MKHLILLIEGKRINRPSYIAGLNRKGFIVESASSGAVAIEKLKEISPSVVIVDAASMRTTGTRICASFRNVLEETPIVLILAANIEKVEDICADEVLYLPFTLQKLLNRIRPYMATSKNKKLVCGPIQLDLKERWLMCGNKKTRLTPRLFMLMQSLMKNPDEVLVREDLFRKIWETDYIGDTRSLDVHISWLRKAVENDPRHPVFIKTERGIGYRLEVEKPHRPKKKS